MFNQKRKSLSLEEEANCVPVYLQLSFFFRSRRQLHDAFPEGGLVIGNCSYACVMLIFGSS